MGFDIASVQKAASELELPVQSMWAEGTTVKILLTKEATPEQVQAANELAAAVTASRVEDNPQVSHKGKLFSTERALSAVDVALILAVDPTDVEALAFAQARYNQLRRK